MLNSFEQLDYDMSPSPEQLLEIYSNGFQGVRNDIGSYKALRRVVPRFHDVFSEFVGAGKGKLSLPFKAALALDPGFGSTESQTTGDCYPGDLEITTPYGVKNISNFCIGDLVITPHGNSRRVIDTIKKKYSGKMIKLVLDRYNKDISATPDHKLWTLPNINNKVLDDCDDTIVEKSISDISIGDYVCIAKPIDENSVKNIVFDLSKYCTDAITEESDFKILRTKAVQSGYVRAKNSKNQIKRHVTLDEKLGWLLGIYLAEGGIDGINNERITFNIGSHEGILAAQIKQYCVDIFGIEPKIYQVPSKPSVIYVRIYNILIAHLFKELCSGNTYTKSIHQLFNKSFQHVRLSILKGWMDGDGHIYNSGRSSGVSVSKGLINNMFDLANSCGLYPRISTRPANVDKNGVNHQEAYDLHFNQDATTTIQNVLTEQLVSCEYNNKLVTKYGMVVKVIDKQEYELDDYVYCLNIDIDHAFIANGVASLNCVSHSTRNAGTIDYCIDALFGETEFKGRLATENIYGWRGHGGQGADCARLATYVSQQGPGGFLPRTKYNSGSSSVDLSVYNGSTGHNWGRSGTPSWLNQISAENKALRVFALKSVDEAIDAISMGFGISMCSGYGFSSTRNSDGLCEQSGGWSHAMAWTAVDDTDQAHQKYGGPLFLIQNSWGKWNGGPRVHEQPEGSFFIRPEVASKMIRGGGGWVIASVRGYNRELVYDMQNKVAELSAA